jgi:hypothetical protein
VQDAGIVRADIDGADLMHLKWPICTYATLSEDQSHCLPGMVVDGLRRPA